MALVIFLNNIAAKLKEIEGHIPENQGCRHVARGVRPWIVCLDFFFLLPPLLFWCVLHFGGRSSYFCPPFCLPSCAAVASMRVVPRAFCWARPVAFRGPAGGWAAGLFLAAGLGPLWDRRRSRARRPSGCPAPPQTCVGP